MNPNPDFPCLDGDLLFMDLDCFGGCDAIEEVKTGIFGARISHVGVFLRVAGVPYVVEAFPPEVRLTPFPVYARRAVDVLKRPRICVGRLRPEDQHLIPAALSFARGLRGLPYDQVFLTGEDAYYCSELVVDMFRAAAQGADVFPEEPMSFRDETTGEILEYWVRYYAQFGRPVPDGEPGSHPATISKSDRLSIVARLGDVSGWLE